MGQSMLFFSFKALWVLKLATVLLLASMSVCPSSRPYVRFSACSNSRTSNRFSLNLTFVSFTKFGGSPWYLGYFVIVTWGIFSWGILSQPCNHVGNPPWWRNYPVGPVPFVQLALRSLPQITLMLLAPFAKVRDWLPRQNCYANICLFVKVARNLNSTPLAFVRHSSGHGITSFILNHKFHLSVHNTLALDRILRQLQSSLHFYIICERNTCPCISHKLKKCPLLLLRGPDFSVCFLLILKADTWVCLLVRI